MKSLRHGDVQLIRVDSLPQDARSLGERRELAFGEVTGHAHRINVGELFETRDGKLYLKAIEGTKLGHEEHKTKPIEPGIYFIGIKRQYNPDGGWSRVQD